MVETTEEVLNLLRKALRDEIVSGYYYLAASTALDGVRGEEVAAELREEFQDEYGHAQTLVERLEVFDEVPQEFDMLATDRGPMELPDSPSPLSGDTLFILDTIIAAEEAAIERYRSLAEAAEEAGDRATRRLAEDLLADEEEHLDQFESYRSEFAE